MISERIKTLERECALRGEKERLNPRSHFEKDYHTAGLTLYAGLPQWEKAAKARAYAMANQEALVDENDRLGGRVYIFEVPCETTDPDLNYWEAADKAFREKYPDADEMIKNQLIGGINRGHITWFFDRILTLGLTGFRARYEEALLHAKDEEAEQFYQGVLIMLDAVQAFNDKHIEAYEKIGNTRLAEMMKKVPRYPAESFEEAVQSFFMQHICVMKDSPFGGNGPGRLDYYLWPYLERDLKAGRCTLEQAKEIIDELFLRMDERVHASDSWVEAVMVGGTYPNGASAVNPLTYIMIESIIDLDITHPSVYVRLPENPPEDLLKLCARYMMAGKNRAQVLSDPSIINALVKNGVFYRDAVEYACGGCMEVGIQGMTSDFLWQGFQNPLKMLELMITGGICLRTSKQIPCFKATKGLEAYQDFESFYQDYLKEAERFTRIYMEEQDIGSRIDQKYRPSYLISSMIDDCLERGRNMHAGGARYHDYGMSQIALPNIADALYAIKKAVFEDKFCTAGELTAAMKADFKGFEMLQAKLRKLPKYGINDEEVDALAARVVSDFADMLLRYRTRWGGKGKPVIMTYVFSPVAAAIMGATADGRNSGMGIAHGLTPYSGSMIDGVTSAINSCAKLPYEKIPGGASTMWDFDSSWATEEIVEALFMTYFKGGGQIFQGNTTPIEDLLKARENPEEYPNLIVRVGGFSARFVSLPEELQEDIINRIRHSA
ncbi:MAG: hypothetical protein IKC46_01805 [Lachnospiraceae bacterium]|nr:hypothetical protein [Lachnospiraceae bacterium]